MASSKGFTIIPDATGLEGSYGDPASPRTAKTLNIRAPTTQGSNPTIGKTNKISRARLIARVNCRKSPGLLVGFCFLFLSHSLPPLPILIKLTFANNIHT